MEPQSPRILVIDDDDGILSMLAWLLEDEQYAPIMAATLAQSRHILDSTVCQVVLTDLIGHDLAQGLANAEQLRQYAYPTPVGIMTAHQLSAEQVSALDAFAFALPKPFQVDNLLSLIAASLNIPLTIEEAAQAQTVQRYFAALSSRDWEALLALCADDVTYIIPDSASEAMVIAGKTALRQYTEQTFQGYPEATFSQVRIYPTPTGLAVRYQSSWLTAAEQRLFSGGVLFRFHGNLITQIGVRLNLDALAQS